MAEIAYVKSTTDSGDLLVTWSSVAESDTFQQFPLDEVVNEISCHVTGTFGGATAFIEGGNVASEMLLLTQLGGSDAKTTVADIFSLNDRPLYIQPRATGGTSQSLDVYMLVRR